MRELSDRQLEDMFELDDAPGPAREIDDARAGAIVAGVLGGAGFPPPGGPGGSGGGAGAHGGSAHVAASKAASGITAGKLAWIAGGVATLALGSGAWLALRTPVSATANETAVAIDVPRSAPGTTAPPSETAPIDMPRSAPAVEPLPPASAASVAPQSGLAGTPPRLVEPNGALPTPVEPSHAPRSRVRSELRPASRGSSATHTPVPPEPVRMAAQAGSAAPRDAPEPAVPDDLLAKANAARAAHRWREADALYSRVVSEGRAELAVQTALVASASLHLEHLGDPAGAARRFRAALAAGSAATLAEDARWGLAEAARATGDATAETGALDDFLAHHPGSPLVARARARRAQLGGAR